MSYQIFISYRRKGGDVTAKLICEALKNRGYTVFYDYDSLKGGFFDSRILENIDECDDFILVLPPKALDRCKYREGDWVRQEIRHALKNKKNIIPVMLNKFKFPKKLPQDIQDVSRFSGILFQMDYFDAVIDKIVERLTAMVGKAEVAEKKEDTVVQTPPQTVSDSNVERSNEKATETPSAESHIDADTISEWRKKLELYERLYSLSSEDLGEEHPDAINALSNLAYTHFKLGNFQKSLEYYEKAYHLKYKTMGLEHPETLTTLSNLVCVYNKLANYQKSLELSNIIYPIRCRVLGEEHTDTLETLDNISFIYKKLGNTAKVLELSEKVYSARCRVLGEEHPNTLVALDNIAYSHRKLNDYATALELYEKIYAIRVRLLGEDHPDTVYILENIAYTYYTSGDMKNAVKYYEKHYALKYKDEKESPQAFGDIRSLGYMSRDIGDFQKTLAFFEIAYGMSCNIYGTEAPESLTMLENMAFAHFKLGNIQESAELYEKVYSSRVKTSGEDDPDTKQARKNLYAALSNLNAQN